MSTKFVIKNEKGQYYGEVDNGSWTSWLDVDHYKIHLFDTEEEAQDFIDKSNFIKKTAEHPEIGKISSSYVEVSNSDPAVWRARHELEEQLLNVRGHKDSLVSLLKDNSLTHDMNAICGRVGRQLEAAGIQYTNAEAYEYSDLVHHRAYYDKEDKWLPHKMLQDNNLAFKARKLAGVIATLADTLALLDRYEEEASTYKKDIAEK